jgi:hypothetical protein
MATEIGVYVTFTSEICRRTAAACRHRVATTGFCSGSRGALSRRNARFLDFVQLGKPLTCTCAAMLCLPSRVTRGVAPIANFRANLMVTPSAVTATSRCGVGSRASQAAVPVGVEFSEQG